MPVPSLDDVVIKVSVGIGRTLPEAECALAEAKSRKKEGRYFNIEMYGGDPLQPLPVQENVAVASYRRLESRLSVCGDIEALLDLESLKHDPKTGLLNRMGYEVEVSKLRDRGMYGLRIIMLIDGDGMKELNTLIGYEETDRYLAAMGLALRDQVRSGIRAGQVPRGHDILLNRKNDSGGDEFIVDISCDHADAEKIAERYVCAMYAAQAELNREDAADSDGCRAC